MYFTDIYASTLNVHITATRCYQYHVCEQNITTQEMTAISGSHRRVGCAIFTVAFHMPLFSATFSSRCFIVVFSYGYGWLHDSLALCTTVLTVATSRLLLYSFQVF